MKKISIFHVLLMGALTLGIIGCSRRTVGQLLEDGFQENGVKAINIYSKAIRKDENCVEGYWRRGDEYFKMGQYSRAIIDFNRAIQIDSAYNAGYLFGDRGNAEEALGNFEKAIIDYTTALKICPRTAPYTPTENFFFYRGRTRLQLGDTSEALLDTDSALFYWPAFPRARYQRARIEVIKGEYQKAANDYYERNPITPDMASDKEFVADVFYYGYLKYRTNDSSYCNYWRAAAKYKYPPAILYTTNCCQAGK